MGMKHFNPTTPSLRNMTVSTFDEITKKTPEKSLLATKKKNASKKKHKKNEQQKSNLQRRKGDKKRKS